MVLCYLVTEDYPKLKWVVLLPIMLLVDWGIDGRFEHAGIAYSTEWSLDKCVELFHLGSSKEAKA